MQPNFEITLEYAPTTDGWELALTRYKPFNFDKNKSPILLCHGLACNRYSFDFNEKYSLARYLAEKGFDTWVLELRGHGKSRRKGIRKKFNWNFDTYAIHDAPDAVKYIKNKYMEKGVETKILWVGHSMGGMIAYAYGSTPEGKENLKGVVTIASPVILNGLLKNLKEENLQWLIDLVKLRCPHRINQPFLTPFYLGMKWSKELIEKFIVNKNNIDEHVLNDFLKKGVEIISCKVLYQFAFMMEMGDFCYFPKYPRLCKLFRNTVFSFLFCPRSYIKSLRKFSSPLLVIAGGGDRLATKEDVFIVKNFVKTDVTLKQFSEENPSADYGHIDLLLGLNANEEIYPAIYDWLEKHC